ncbi:MAG: hypothetical protein WCS73_01530 [Lentisphaeria bacterium]
MPEICKTDLFILRKIQHTGSNLIVAGVSPIYGKISFYIRNAVTKKNNFHVFDLFRVVSVSYNDNGNDLLRPQTVDLKHDFNKVANRFERFQAGCRIAKFSLSNIPNGVGCPFYYRSLVAAFHRLAESELCTEAVLTGIALTYLKESGWFGESKLSVAEMAQCQLLIQMAVGGDIPALTVENWQKLWEWAEHLLIDIECPL